VRRTARSCTCRCTCERRNMERRSGDEKGRRSSRWSIARDSVAVAERAAVHAVHAVHARASRRSGGYESGLWADRWERPRTLKWRLTPATEPACLATRSCDSARRVRGGAAMRRATFSRPSLRISEYRNGLCTFSREPLDYAIAIEDSRLWLRSVILSLRVLQIAFHPYCSPNVKQNAIANAVLAANNGT